MEINIKGLVAAGHEMTSELKAECGAVDMRSVAKLLSDLATQLEVQLARANALAEDQQKAIESIKQADSAVKLAHEKFSALAAENEALKSNLIYWGGEDSGPVRSPLDYAHEAGLESGEEFEMQVAARMPNLTYRVVSSSRFKTEIELIGGLLPETPATDAFLSEVRAQGVDAAIEAAKNLVAQEYEYKDFKAAQSDCCMHPGSDLVGKVEMTEWLVDFAAQLRKGGNQ
ncbi:hypothetical protein PJL30_003002 [Escherichia coli]|nr:hypothetical protein [Escherichia coli]EIY9471848.1 hypothetical protein [Escherichia coli]EKJ5479475.1 hypothetical protein [Escherichia coli]MBB8364460.1 hypothetical protein [Escherichia coli]HED3764051.1 hypothetical protein [Escherichia coli]